MPDTWTLTLGEPDRYGREQARTVNLTIDIRDFKDKAGFAYLLMAANPHLSVRDTQAVLAAVGEQHERPVGWISRRRWLFHGKGMVGAKRNADGKDEKARRIMEENPRLSSRQMAYLLRENGIRRSREWVRRNRVSAN
jgi:hypothetical protein